MQDSAVVDVAANADVAAEKPESPSPDTPLACDTGSPLLQSEPDKEPDPQLTEVFPTPTSKDQEDVPSDVAGKDMRWGSSGRSCGVGGSTKRKSVLRGRFGPSCGVAGRTKTNSK